MSFENAKYTLITNVNFVQNGNIRMEAHALLIEEGITVFGEESPRLRGFGTDPAWSVFTHYLDRSIHFPVTMREAHGSNAVMLGQDGATKPLFGGAVLRLGEQSEYFLQVDDGRCAIDVAEYPKCTDIDEVWRDLVRKTARYCHTPYSQLCSGDHPTQKGFGNDAR